MKPVRHTMGRRRVSGVMEFKFVECGMEQSIPFQNVDCTIEGSDIDLGVAEVERTEKTVAEFGMPEMMLAGGRRELGLGIHFAFVRGGAEVKGIAGRKADGNVAAVIFEEVVSVGEKLAVKENVAFRGLRMNVKAAEIDQAEIAADGRDVQAAGAADTLKGTADGLDGEIACSVLKVNTSGDGLDIHVAQDVGNGDGTGIIVDLKLGVLGDTDFVVGAEIFGSDGVR